jgi:hypothetical protein
VALPGRSWAIYAYWSSLSINLSILNFPKRQDENRCHTSFGRVRDRLTHLMEGIGLALDVRANRMFMAHLGRSLYTASLDGATGKVLLVLQGNMTGVAYTD